MSDIQGCEGHRISLLSSLLIFPWLSGWLGFLQQNCGFMGQAITYSSSGLNLDRHGAATLPPAGQQQQLVRLDYTATATVRGTLEGSLKARFFPLNANPQTSNPAVEFSNNFRGQLIQAK